MNFSPELLKQLVDTFQDELREGASTLVNGLVDLEKDEQHPEKRASNIESVFRTAHNLKGAARGLGIDHVGDIAHHIENIFSAIKDSNQAVNKQTIDVCLDAVDKMQLAMESFVSNSPLTFDIDELKSRMEMISENKSAGTPEQKTVKKAPAVKAKEPQPQKPEKEGSDKSVSSDTIRVPLKIIDKLSELSEEVQASKIDLEDHRHHVKALSKIIQEFGSSWKELTNEMKSSNNADENSRLSKTMTRANDELVSIMTSIHKIANDIGSQSTDYSRLSSSIQDEVAMLRLVPANNLLALLPRYVRELSMQLKKQAEVEISGGDVYIDKYVLEGLKDPLNHILRNAIDHGIESPEERVKNGKSKVGKIRIDVKDAGSKIYFEISDDGAGINYDAIKKKISVIDSELKDKVDTLTQEQIQDFIFHSGFSTKSEVTSVSGRGVGLDVVKKNVQALKGTIEIKSSDKGTKFIICVPLSLSSERGLIVRCEDQIFIIPTANVDRVMQIDDQHVVAIEGGHAILINEHPIVIKTLSSVLGVSQQPKTSKLINAVILKSDNHVAALEVDEILGEREIVIKAIQDPLTNISCVSGATLLDRNKIAIVLEPDQLVALALNTVSQYLITETSGESKRTESLRVLVVDDSITTRTLEKNILESKGYVVTTAVNGQEGWDILQKQSFSLVITDINMPVMDGFVLTDKIKKSDKFGNLPVIIVTSLGSDAEKARGVEVGADAYIVKNEFESGALLQMIEQLV